MPGLPSSPPARPLPVVAALVAAALALAGCATNLPPTGEGSSAFSGRIVRVVAAENFWGSIVAQLGGTHAHVVSIIDSPNTDPHAYEPTAADARVLADAQVAVENGAGYDPWMPRLLAADGGSRTVLDVGRLVGVAPGGNPHLWYDPSYVERFITATTADLVRADPADRDYFAARRTAYEQVGLAGYHVAIDRIRARFAGTPVGASESIVAYLCRALELDLVTPPSFLRAVSEGTDVSAAATATIDRQIRTRSIAVYLENTQNLTPDVQTQVSAARAAGIPLTSVTETLEPATTTFQAWQTAQLNSLDAALERSHG
ncbi:MAG TPA: zinc ABC transporter substrate-binding protein [Acidimicrobiales bacterium]